MSCKESVEALSSGRELSLAQRAMLRLHLLMCGPCGRFMAQLRILREAVGRLNAGQARLSDGERLRLEDRIIASIFPNGTNRGFNKN